MAHLPDRPPQPAEDHHGPQQWASMRRWLASVAWPTFQGAAAATVAWVIAKHFAGHAEPFFAPLAAVIALNAPFGERGLNALRLFAGVLIGIVVAEITLTVFKSSYTSLGLATFVAIAIAQSFTSARLVIAQAAAGAVLTVASGDRNVGVERFIDALIGGGVALVFSQILFVPEPLNVLRRAEATALGKMASGLRLTGHALHHHDRALGQLALESLRELRDELSALADTRRASTRVARHTLIWRTRRRPVVQESENAGTLDLLGGSCLMLARTAIETTPEEGGRVEPVIEELAMILSDLEGHLDDRDVRQQAADQALRLGRRLATSKESAASRLGAATIAARMVAIDIMVFAGVQRERARQAMESEVRSLRVHDPPKALRISVKRLPIQGFRRRLPKRLRPPLS